MYKKFKAEKRIKISAIASVPSEGLSYNALRRAMRKKDVKVNGERVSSDMTLEAGDVLEVYFAPSEKKDYRELYADENVVAVDKRAGITSEDLFSEIERDYGKAFFIHRLDRNTSGVTIFALNERAASELKTGFKKRSFSKIYEARVAGVLERKQATLTAYLGKDAENSVVKISDKPIKGYEKIITGYEVISEDGETSLLKVRLFTGKTHQIRAHLAHIGHPIIGDGKYGDRKINEKFRKDRQMLKAVRLTLAFSEGDLLYYLDGRSFCTPSDY